MKLTILARGGWYATIAALFLLPWQARIIFWRPWVGTTESEFGVMSVYVTMLVVGIAASCFIARDAAQYIRTNKIPYLYGACGGILVALGVYTWIQTYPTPAHAWILHVFFATALGYAVHCAAVQGKKTLYVAVVSGLGMSLALGVWQMIAGYFPESTFLGMATRNAAQAGDAVLMWGERRVLRMYGSFPHPNVFGAAIALTCAGGITLKKAQEKVGDLPKAVVMGAGCIAGTGIVLVCISRSAALAIVCALLAWYGYTRARKIFMVSAMLLPVLVWTMQFTAPELLALRGSHALEMRSVNERVEQVLEWKHIMSSSGLEGVGIYKYPEADAENAGKGFPAWKFQPIHNVFMLILAEIGIGWSLVAASFAVYRAWGMRKKLFVYTPFFVCVWSLAWFDHVLWTSWAGMAYVAAMFGFLWQKGEN